MSAGPVWVDVIDTPTKPPYGTPERAAYDKRCDGCSDEAMAAMGPMLAELRAVMYLPDDDPRRQAALADKRRVLTLIEQSKVTPGESASRVTCVYGKCAGAHLDWTEWAQVEVWIDEHMATMPHSARWPNTFRIDHPGAATPGTTYRDAVLTAVDDEPCLCDTEFTCLARHFEESP